MEGCIKGIVDALCNHELSKTEAVAKIIKAVNYSTESKAELFPEKKAPRGTFKNEDVAELFEYFSNKRISKGISSRPLKETTQRKRLLQDRLKDSDLETAKAVIDLKLKHWLGGQLEQYLKPETIIRTSKD